MTDQQPHEETAPQKAIKVFQNMAEKVSVNQSYGFGGAFVIAAPDGTLHELLLMNNTQDLAQFWSLVQSTAQIAIAELQDHKPQAFGRR